MCDGKSCGCSNNQGGSCGGGRTGCGWNHRTLLWVLVALAVGAIIFCTGFKLGMLRSYFGGWGYDNYGGYNMMYRSGNWGPGMMGNWQIQQAVEDVESTSSSKK